MENSPFVGYFFWDLFGIWKTHPSTDIYIYFPACVWSIFSWNIHHDSPGKSSIRWSGNSMVGASQKRSGNAELKTYSYFKTMLYMIWTCCSLEKTWMASPMTCNMLQEFVISEVVQKWLIYYRVMPMLTGKPWVSKFETLDSIESTTYPVSGKPVGNSTKQMHKWWLNYPLVI